MAPNANDLGLMVVSCEMMIAKLFSMFGALSPTHKEAIEQWLKASIEAHVKAGMAPATYQPFEMVLGAMYFGVDEPKKTGLTLVPGKPDGNA